MSDWPCAECRLLRTVLRESWEEPFKGTVSHLIVDFSSSFLLQDRLAVHERVASSGHCGDGGQQANFVNFPFRRGCVQVRDVVDDFWLLRFRSAQTLSMASSNSWRKGEAARGEGEGKEGRDEGQGATEKITINVQESGG